jgi:hypothetical protein
MRLHPVAALLGATLSMAQETQVPAGTKVVVALIGAVQARSARPGDTIYPRQPSQQPLTTRWRFHRALIAPQEPQPLPKLSIDEGAIIGTAMGIAAIGATTLVLLARRGHTTVLPAGASIEMTLTAPVTLDAGKVAVALAMPPPRQASG